MKRAASPHFLLASAVPGSCAWLRTSQAHNSAFEKLPENHHKWCKLLLSAIFGVKEECLLPTVGISLHVEDHLLVELSWLFSTHFIVFPHLNFERSSCAPPSFILSGTRCPMKPACPLLLCVVSLAGADLPLGGLYH